METDKGDGDEEGNWWHSPDEDEEFDYLPGGFEMLGGGNDLQKRRDVLENDLAHSGKYVFLPFLEIFVASIRFSMR